MYTYVCLYVSIRMCACVYVYLRMLVSIYVYILICTQVFFILFDAIINDMPEQVFTLRTLINKCV